MHFGPTVLLGYVSIIELDEAVQREVLFAGGEVDDEGGRYIVESVEFVRLAEVDHVPDQSLLVCDLPVELEVVEAEAFLAQLVILEPEGVLRPFQEYPLG